jgi:hypothetical protein
MRRGWSHGRHGGVTARCLWPDKDLALVVGSRPHGVHGCMRVLKSIKLGTVASVHGCAASTARRRKAARRRGWGGRRQREAAHACTRKGARAQERPALARPGGNTPRKVASRLAVAERRRAQLGRGHRKKKGRAFSLPRQTRARVHKRVDECEGACKGVCSADVKTATEALTAARHGARTRRHRALNKGRRAGCARGGVGSNTCKRLLLNLARRPASDSTTARRRHGKALSDDRDLGSKARCHRG